MNLQSIIGEIFRGYIRDQRGQKPSMSPFNVKYKAMSFLEKILYRKNPLGGVSDQGPCLLKS